MPRRGDEKRHAYDKVAAALAEIDKALGKPWLRRLTAQHYKPAAALADRAAGAQLTHHQTTGGDMFRIGRMLGYGRAQPGRQQQVHPRPGTLALIGVLLVVIAFDRRAYVIAIAATVIAVNEAIHAWLSGRR